MLKTAVLIVGFLSVCHFRLTTGQKRPELGGEDRDKQEIHVEDDAPFDDFTKEHELEDVEPRRMRLVTVDAAMTVDAEGSVLLYLVIDNQVQVLRDGEFYDEFPRADFHVADNMNVQAAFVTLQSQDKRIFYGDKYGKFVTVSGDKERRLKYGPAREFIRDGGPDAAARRSGKVYVFKGCEVAVRNDFDDWGKPVNVATLDLPCNVHAAWKENEKMIILKGDVIWRWNEDGSVDGPDPFGANYKLKVGYALLPVRQEMPSNQATITPIKEPPQQLPGLLSPEQVPVQLPQHEVDQQPQQEVPDQWPQKGLQYKWPYKGF